MSTTTNYGLIKPEETDNYDVADFHNKSMDIIDAQMKKNASAAASAQSTANNAVAALTALAGTGRTTETVKGNADAITNLKRKISMGGLM